MLRKLDRLALTRIVFLVTGLGLSMGLSVIVQGQANTVGSIGGTVRDSQGAVISKAEVLIREERTGFSRTVVANDEGFYSALSLPFGRYSVSTTPLGFKKTVSSGVELHVNENLIINLTLVVGQINETVNVYRDATPVETRSTNVSSLVAEKQVAELRQLLEESGFVFAPRPYTIFFAQKDRLSAAVYEKGPKLLLQGKGIEDFVSFELEPLLEDVTKPV